MLDFILNGGWKSETYKNQINSLDVVSEEMQNVCVGIEKKTATEKREKVFFPMAKTRNYVYYTIGKAHFVFDGTKKRMCITVKESRHGTEHNRTG